MNNKTNFANGFNYFCIDCRKFFSVLVEPNDNVWKPEFCPICGDDNLVSSIDELLFHLEDEDVDPVNYYKAFPPDELIPNSRTGATPRQVANIFDLVTKRHSIPLTVESIAGNCEVTREIVKKVFEEFHITEKP